MAKFKITYRRNEWDREDQQEVHYDSYEEVIADYFTLPDQGGVCFTRDGLPAIYIESCFRIELIADGNL